MSTVIAYSREDLVALIKFLPLGVPTEIRWVRKTGTTTYRFGMDGYERTVKALSNFEVISEEDIKACSYVPLKQGLRTMMKEYRARRRDHRAIVALEGYSHGGLYGLDAVALNAFERRKERIIKNLMRLPKRACN